MAKTYEYNPDTGTYYELEDNLQNPGELFIRPIQDVSSVVETTTRLRNKNATDKGIKEDWWHYATIPTIVQAKMLEKGINFHKKEHMPRVLKEINENYPYLKTTKLRHAIKES